MCGLQHAYMLAPVRVLEVADYEAWLAEQAAAALAGTAAERGQTLAVDFGCAACHSADGSVIVGPTWLGVFGSTETLDDGSTVTVDENYIRQSILDPESHLVAGFPNVMPQNYREQLTDEQIGDIIAYIQSLAE
jgi:cytochrome c oxidase subunit 2